MRELEVLEEQLEELLEEGAIDASDAYEIAILAGLAVRLGSKAEVIAAAQAWKATASDLIVEVFEIVDVDELVECVDALDPSADEHEVEEAVFDFDDFVAAAVWCGRRELAVKPARVVAAAVRMIPEAFESVAYAGKDMARLATVGADLALYDYWLAIADAEVDA